MVLFVFHAFRQLFKLSTPLHYFVKNLMLLRLCFSVLILMWMSSVPAATLTSQPALQTVTACGNDVPLKFDLLPAANTSPPYAAMIVVHGGSWLGGSRTDLHGLLQQLSRMGFVAMSVDYRLAPAARFPAQIEDVKCAVRWLRSHATDYQINPEKIGAFGVSAGAHLLALAAVTPGKWDNTGGYSGVSSQLRCAVLHAPPLDFPNWWQTADPVIRGPMSPRVMLKSLLGEDFSASAKIYQDASPVSYIPVPGKRKIQMPSLLLLQGELDATVPVQQARDFTKKMKAAGAAVELMTVADADHFTFGSQGRQVSAKIQEFLGTCLQ